jgi:hypothetical protein
MVNCRICKIEFPLKRKQLGYNTCIDCGDKIATVEMKNKSKRIAPLFNKGAYQYIPSIKDIKHIGR